MPTALLDNLTGDPVKASVETNHTLSLRVHDGVSINISIKIFIIILNDIPYIIT